MSDTDRRLITTFCIMLLLSGVVMVDLLKISLRREFVEAANTQSTYSVTVDTSRGRIYDHKMRSLAGGRLQYRAVIEPSAETTEHLFGVIEPGELSAISDGLKGRSPFVYVARDASIAGPGVRVFRGEERYGENSVAEHIVGCVDGSGAGASGAEYAFNEYLEECSGSLTAVYTVNSRGRSLSRAEPVIYDTSANSNGGVVLTLDYDIQRVAEEAADEFIERGAIVVVEVPSGKIRACVSRPGFDRGDMAASLERDDAPLIDRAITAYDVGSVFKLVVAAAALDSGIEPEWTCECTGSVQIGSNVFHCSNRSGHGELDMSEAVAGSCNIYFIKLAQQLGGARILEQAKRLGFGEKIMLADNFAAEAGRLPALNSLENPAALANLAFGQGELMATPMHVAQLAAAVANGGMMPETTVFESFVTPKGERFGQRAPAQPQRVMSENTADLLRQFMIKTVVSGTGKKGASEKTTSAAKTGTAQTGMVRDGHKVLQAWYAGFFPADEPKYVCVVLVEDGESGGASAGPVFARIADRLARFPG